MLTCCTSVKNLTCLPSGAVQLECEMCLASVKLTKMCAVFRVYSSGNSTCVSTVLTLRRGLCIVIVGCPASSKKPSQLVRVPAYAPPSLALCCKAAGQFVCCGNFMSVFFAVTAVLSVWREFPVASLKCGISASVQSWSCQEDENGFLLSSRMCLSLIHIWRCRRTG